MRTSMFDPRSKGGLRAAACLLLLSAAWVHAGQAANDPDHAEDVQALELRAVATKRFAGLARILEAELYLAPEQSTADLLDDVPKRLQIEYFVTVPARLFASATRRKVAENVDRDDYRRLQARVDALSSLYESVRPGDRYVLTYDPATGLELAKNERVLGVFSGADFARAVFSIWFGDRPLDATLRRKMLSVDG